MVARQELEAGDVLRRFKAEVSRDEPRRGNNTNRHTMPPGALCLEFLLFMGLFLLVLVFLFFSMVYISVCVCVRVCVCVYVCVYWYVLFFLAMFCIVLQDNVIALFASSWLFESKRCTLIELLPQKATPKAHPMQKHDSTKQAHSCIHS